MGLPAHPSRKSHRIPPLYQVLKLFPLINLVDEFRVVIHQAHGYFTRNSGTPEPVNRRDPQAVKTKMGLLHLDNLGQ